MTFKRGMTIGERRQLREEILAKHLEKARQEALVARLTLRCRNALFYTSRDPEQARDMHAQCKAEERGGMGCLCPCHDVITGAVEAGQMEQMELPLLFD